MGPWNDAADRLAQLRSGGASVEELEQAAAQELAELLDNDSRSHTSSRYGFAAPSAGGAT